MFEYVLDIDISDVFTLGIPIVHITDVTVDVVSSPPRSAAPSVIHSHSSIIVVLFLLLFFDRQRCAQVADRELDPSCARRRGEKLAVGPTRQQLGDAIAHRSGVVSPRHAPVGEARLGIVGADIPDRAALAQFVGHAVPGIAAQRAGPGNGVEVPQVLARLGIEGGISILGTTGVVRPFSCSAWIASIHRGIDVARANALTHVMGSTGATSEGWGRATYELPDIALIDMGDFVGGMLKYIRRHPVPNLSILGGFGKMVKLSQGATDLHSARSQVDFRRLAGLAGECGMDPARVAGANSVLEVSDMASVPQRSMLADAVAAGALDTAMAQLQGAPTRVEVVIIGRDGTLLGRAGELSLGAG